MLLSENETEMSAWRVWLRFMFHPGRAKLGSRGSTSYPAEYRTSDLCIDIITESEGFRRRGGA